ncbi:hypothetical protein [Sphingobium sp.]|uniref:hypothetical protein n=1 Tax=Sphingobium sp. TaxID=1912891 RepID=UPI00262BE4BC|nr:hypothetical protein [Sphingobium sp.]
MFRTVIIALALVAPVSVATAQDIAPVISPGQAAEGIFHRSVAEGQARRIREGRSSANAAPTAGQRRACASLPRFRAELGANEPRVRKLEGLCAGAGL